MSGINAGAFGATGVSFTQNTYFDLVNGPAWTGSMTAGQSNTSFGSTLLLQRMMIPTLMNLTEVDLIEGLAFASSSLSGAASMSQSFAVFKFVNATSLSSVFSASSSWAWISGSASANLTGVQNGWTGTFVHSMGLSSGSAGVSRITGGEYVVGHIINVSASAANGSAGGSNMTLSLWGVNMATNVTFGTAAAISNASTGGVSAISNAGTAQVVGLSNAGTAAFARLQTSTSSSQTTSLTAFSAAPTVFSRTVFSAAPTQAAFTAFTAAPSAVNAVTTGGLVFNPVIAFQNTGSSFSSASPSWFRAGIMATAAIPANITLTSTNVTMTGAATGQPWFGLIGS